MSAGVITPSPGSLDSSGSIDLSGAALPSIDTEATQIDPIPLVGFDAFVLPPGVPFDHAGVEAPVHGLAVFEHIHVIPRYADVSSVFSDTQISVEVWNAFRVRARILDEITIDGPAGITVEDPYGLPTHYPATESKLYNVLVDATGDPEIDNLITWVFQLVDPLGTNLRIVGTRFAPWAFEADIQGTIRERYGYLTDLLEARDGSEQRIQLRGAPTGSIGFQVLLEDERDAQYANALMYGNQLGIWGVPRWQYQDRLLSDAAVGTTTITINTAYLPYVVGGLVLLWRSSRLWEVRRIAEVEADHLVTDFPVVSNWPANVTRVMPIVLGRLSPSEILTWPSLIVGSADLTFEVERFTP